MPEIHRYAVCADPDEWGDAETHPDLGSAEAVARYNGQCVVELTYEYAGAETVRDFRPEIAVDDEPDEVALANGRRP